MKRNLFRLGLFALVATLASCDTPTNLQGPGTLKGLVALPPGSFAAVVEIRTQAPVDSVGIGFGKTVVYVPSVQPYGYRFLLLQREALATEMPVRVFTQDRALKHEGVVTQVSDSLGSINPTEVAFLLR